MRFPEHESYGARHGLAADCFIAAVASAPSERMNLAPWQSQAWPKDSLQGLATSIDTANVTRHER
jgi:hypothetical protein